MARPCKIGIKAYSPGWSLRKSQAFEGSYVDDHMTEIGHRIRSLREQRGATQAELAAALEMTDESIISKVENGLRGLAAAELAGMCDFFGVRSDMIVFGETTDEPVGALLRADSSADAQRVVERMEEAFADLRYVRALVES
jgi:transcriptional regulator with XRE-family HTH domain